MSKTLALPGRRSIRELVINKVAWGLNLVFSNGVGYPRTRWLVQGGARNSQAFKNYLRRHQVANSVWYKANAGLSAMDAALDIPLTDYAAWGEVERVVANVETLYRGYSGGDRLGTPQVMVEMAEFEHRLAAREAAR